MTQGIRHLLHLEPHFVRNLFIWELFVRPPRFQIAAKRLALQVGSTSAPALHPSSSPELTRLFTCLAQSDLTSIKLVIYVNVFFTYLLGHYVSITTIFPLRLA